MTWSITFLKVLFGLSVVCMLVSVWQIRKRNLKAHIVYMGVAVFTQLSIFSYVVLDRFVKGNLSTAASHPPRDSTYWTLFGLHVGFGIIAILMLIPQMAIGPMVYYLESKRAKLLPWHRRLGITIICCSVLSFLASVPL